MKRSLILTVCLAALTFTSQAQNQILFHSQTVEFNSNVAEFAAQPDFKPFETEVGFAYRLVEFSQLPDNDLKAELSEAGIELLDYMPYNSFFAKISVQADFSFLQKAQVRSVNEIAPEWKMSLKLFNRDYQSHSIDGNDHISLVVLLFPGYPFQAVQAALSRNDWTIYKPLDNGVLELSLPLVDWPLLAQFPFVQYIEETSPAPELENYTGTSNHRSNYISPEFPGASRVDGSGVNVGLGDDGVVGYHLDFHNRIVNTFTTSNGGDHGDHVAGTILGAGNLNSQHHGQARDAGLLVYSYWNNLDSISLHYNSYNVRITSNSLSNGCNAGYTTFARTTDQRIRMMPHLMSVFSAGNEGAADCGYGAGNGWGNITGGVKIAKNAIAVGALSNLDALAGFSSRGPTTDGRIKPDICAVGSNVTSTGENNTYYSASGTSMSCPGTSGVLAQLYDGYRTLNNGNDPPSALIKAALMNTADDLGNPGPDFRFGYGRINARRAYQTLENNTYFEETVTTGTSKTFNISVPVGAQEIRVMLYWNDYEGTANSLIALVNDLKLQVTAPNATVYDPWVLDHSPNATTLNANAIRATDFRNNAEQVTLENPPAGNYTITVSGVTVPQGPQSFVVVYEVLMPSVVLTYPIGGEGFVPGQQEIIRWDAFGGTGNFLLEYTVNNGATWTTIGSPGPTARSLTWTVPSISANSAKVRISRGGLSSESLQKFAIIGVPTGFQATFVCPDSIGFIWNGIVEAGAYEISQLGSKWMDSISVHTSSPGIVLSHDPSKDNWYNIRAVTVDGTKGRQSISILVPAGLNNCSLTNDLTVEAISPTAGNFFSCDNLSNTEVRLLVKNISSNPIYGFTIAYSLNNLPTISLTLPDTILGGASQSVAFPANVSLVSGTPYSFEAFVFTNSDQNAYNDTSRFDFVADTTLTLMAPFVQNFDSYSNCAVTTNCGATVCALGGGWFNNTNVFSDDIDWRVHSGTTATASTGPTNDHTLGTGQGKFLYLESSGGCTFQRAELISPCIDLSNLTAPVASIWYHMYGVEQNTLHLDIYSETTGWVEDVDVPRQGDQGNQWLQWTVSLNQFMGQTIKIRVRGYTGAGFYSDLAIDDISVYNYTLAPTAGFSVSANTICNAEVLTLSDNSSNIPTAYQWDITPNTFSFVNGTSATSVNPQVFFHTTGTYSIQQIVSNWNGSDTITQNSAVTVTAGQAAGFTETFDSFTNCGTATNCAIVCNLMNGWKNDSNDNTDWRTNSGSTPSTGTGPTSDHTGNNGKYLYLEATSCFNSTALLYSPCVDLSGLTSGQLSFWYHMNGTDVGEVHLDIMSDGVLIQDITPTLYGSQGNQWNQKLVDLAPFLGTQVQFIFRGVTGPDFLSDIALDDISIFNNDPAPVADFAVATPAGSCTNDTLVFSDNSTGIVGSYLWNFGAGAVPPSSTTAGPHQVYYTYPGSKTVSLLVQNGGGSNTFVQNVQIDAYASAAFSFSWTGAGGTYNFILSSTTGMTGVTWDFGDGTTSTQNNPIHTFSANGTYSVSCAVLSDCGVDSTSITLSVFGVGIGIEEAAWEGLALYPNPAVDKLFVRLPDGMPNAQLLIMDVSGRNIGAPIALNEREQAIDLTGFSAGTYLFQFSSEKGTRTERVVIR